MFEPAWMVDRLVQLVNRKSDLSPRTLVSGTRKYPPLFPLVLNIFFMTNIPYDDWCYKAAREISDALSEENRRVAYYAAGGGDGWARSYGAGNFRSPDYAAIIDKHYRASLVKSNDETSNAL